MGHVLGAVCSQFLWSSEDVPFRGRRPLTKNKTSKRRRVLTHLGSLVCACACLRACLGAGGGQDRRVRRALRFPIEFAFASMGADLSTERESLCHGPYKLSCCNPFCCAFVGCSPVDTSVCRDGKKTPFRVCFSGREL